jgi:hypothetical protein
MPETDEKSREGEVIATLIGIGSTALAGLVAYFILLDWAVEGYEHSHNMGTCIRDGGWFKSDYEVPCRASSSDLPWPTYILTVVFPTLIYIAAYPAIGRMCVSLWNSIGAELAETLGLENDYFEIPRPVDMIAGSVWGIFVVLIPLQLVGLLIGKVYRAVWF